ncbi:cell division protein ZapD [Thalassotalea piscium]|uniref:Cell division protein ZapD n=1 Tax=Thalassotalea piscium TaxID=1230533 RepID=A0A7X0NE47_9GAMM|nr:cell division protein ZapD [Thalassotalea piscium]MBB6541766.1 cell division protein ZapD [Thalassotalea piscium]
MIEQQTLNNIKNILYEHPLNERIRSYLKLEQMFTQLKASITVDAKVSYHIYFNAMFSIIDTLERNDIRGDLIKDLEKLEQNLVIWSKSPEINDSALQENLKNVVELICHLRAKSPQWCQVKNDQFLMSLKQRYAIQGGNCSFDLPQLQFWLNQPGTSIEQSMSSWLNLFNQIDKALALILKFIRQRVLFEPISSESGFYQDSGEGVLLLRIRVAHNAPYYPTVSGNKFRYSIRFMAPCEQLGKRYYSQSTDFELARC